MILKNNWGLSDLLLLYWTESGIIGFFTILKMTMSKFDKTKETTKSIFIVYVFKIFFILFFILHFVGFMLGHAVFLFVFILKKSGSLQNIDLIINELFNLNLAIFFIFISHAFLFIWNFIIKNEKENSTFFMEMTMPYRRIVVMHITIILGAFLTLIFGVNRGFLIIFIIMKIVMDVNGHIKERSIRKKEKNLYNKE